MRTRSIVAIAALIAAVALVVGTGSAGAQPSRPARAIDATQFRAVVLALPSGPSMTIEPSVTANEPGTGSGPLDAPASPGDGLDAWRRAAGWLGPNTPIIESGVAPGAGGTRPDTPQPSVAAVAVPKATPTPAPTAAPTSAPAAAPAVVVTGWHFDPDISWYGPGFYGHRTACGETLTTTILGVASPTLPCGTRVTFRNPANGRTVTVPVIDRGPYVSGRIWDMSGGLCTYLAHCYTGTMDWRLAG